MTLIHGHNVFRKHWILDYTTYFYINFQHSYNCTHTVVGVSVSSTTQQINIRVRHISSCVKYWRKVTVWGAAQEFPKALNQSNKAETSTSLYHWREYDE